MRYFVKHGCKGLQRGEDSKADSCFVTQELRLAWDRVVNMPRRNIDAHTFRNLLVSMNLNEGHSLTIDV